MPCRLPLLGSPDIQWVLHGTESPSLEATRQGADQGLPRSMLSYRSRSRNAFCISSMTLNLNVSFPHLGGQHATHDDTCLAATVPKLPGSWLPSDALLSPRTRSAHLQQLPTAAWAPSSKPQGGCTIFANFHWFNNRQTEVVIIWFFLICSFKSHPAITAKCQKLKFINKGFSLQSRVSAPTPLCCGEN